jgi:hypothetical protein
MATEKIPIRTVFDGATAIGLAEFQATEVVGVTYGGIGTNTLTSNSILLGNGTSAVQSSAIQIVGTSLSSTDSSTININEGLTVEGNLIVTGSITGTIANTSLTNSSFTLTDDTSSTTTISLGETLKIAGGSGVDTLISGDTLTISLESTVVTETSSDTLTNKTISGSDNTISNIGNSSLTNSSITLSDDTSSTTTINLGETLKISGTSNEIETVISGDTITIGLPSNVTIGNNLIVTGDLTVNGTTTTINSTTLSVDDKNIELASVTTPTDTTADGAGITIKGATDKTFNWLDATDSFTSSEHIDLVSGKVFKINNSTVLSSTEVLGKSVPSGTIVGTSDSQTLTTKTISGSDNTITNIANSSLTNSSFTIVDDSSTTSTISLGEALLLAGGTGITSVISGDSITFNIDNTVATLSDTQTLTNKTLTTPIISSISNSGTITLPTATDTLVGRATTDTLTNKSINLSNNTITGTIALFNTALSDADFATLAGSETLTNKTLTTPIISSISNTGTLTLPTSTDTLVGRATTDTLTNKTLTSPKINEDVVITATATELNYTDGVTSAIQTQLDAKASRSFAIAQAVALG